MLARRTWTDIGLRLVDNFGRIVCNSSSGRVQLMSRYGEHLVSVGLETQLTKRRLRNTRLLSWTSANFPDGSSIFFSGTKFKQSICFRFNWARRLPNEHFTLRHLLSSHGAACLTYPQPRLRMGRLLDQMVGIYGSGLAYWMCASHERPALAGSFRALSPNRTVRNR